MLQDRVDRIQISPNKNIARIILKSTPSNGKSTGSSGFDGNMSNMNSTIMSGNGTDFSSDSSGTSSFGSEQEMQQEQFMLGSSNGSSTLGKPLSRYD